MAPRSLRFFIRTLLLAVAMAVAAPEIHCDIMAAEAPAPVKKKKSKSRSSSVKKKKKRSSGKSTVKKRKKRKKTRPAILTVYQDSSTWIHKGRRGIIISKDSTGTVRAMVPFSANPHSGQRYAEAINAYAKALAADSVKVYSIIAPSQGEFYMPPLTALPEAERKAIKVTAGYLNREVTPVFVADTLKNHLSEDIYYRTDHHWSALGAYYAAKALAVAAEVEFTPLDRYRRKTVADYVGTMYKFSGDPEVKHNPEEFVYYLPPEGYESEFIIYTLSGGSTAGESEPHKESFFKDYPDGSGAAYCTFMGGDPRTVKVTCTGGTHGRKLLLVKDSYGNSMAPCLFGSFEEVHVVDFRYFPHNLADYARENGITDMVFVNCISIAFAPSTANRLFSMLTARNGQFRKWDSDDDAILTTDPDDEEGEEGEEETEEEELD